MMDDKLSDGAIQLKKEVGEILLNENHPLNKVAWKIVKDPDFLVSVVQLFTLNADMTNDNRAALDIILHPNIWNGRFLGTIILVMVMLDLNDADIRSVMSDG